MVEDPYPGEDLSRRSDPPPVPPQIEVRPVKSHWRHRCEQHIYEFSNGYQVSVVRGGHTYGGLDGLWEMATLANGRLVTTTALSFGEDLVEGHLTDEAVASRLMDIVALPVVPDDSQE